MVAYNFQKQFADDVSSGRKTQTIRANGKRRHARAGEPVQLYTGMRTKSCRKLRDPDPICQTAIECRIEEANAIIGGDRPVTDLDKFAQEDGFTDFEQMRDWFRDTHGLPFAGTLIAWAP